MPQTKNNRLNNFVIYAICFIVLVTLSVGISYFSMSKYETDAVKKSIARQKIIKIDDVESKLNEQPGGFQVSEVLDKNKLDNKFLKTIQKSNARYNKIVSLSENKLSPNQAKILSATLYKIKLENIAIKAKQLTQTRIYRLIIIMFFAIFLSSLAIQYFSNQEKSSLTKFIGTALKEMITFVTLSVATYTIINSLFSNDSVSNASTLSYSLTFLYAWMPIYIILIAAVAVYNIFSTTNHK